MPTSYSFVMTRRLILGCLLVCLLPGFSVFAQPALLRDIKPGAGSSDPYRGVEILSTYYFSADNGTNGRELWKSDGSPAGTVLLKDINPGAGSSNPFSMVNLGGALYFLSGSSLYKSDGTQGGTVVVKTLAGTANRMILESNTLYISTTEGAGSGKLWKSNGTTAGTVVVKALPGPPTWLMGTSGIVFFFVEGSGLYRSNGTEAGTVLGPNLGTPTEAVVHSGLIYFLNNTGFWAGDGTVAGTKEVFVDHPSPSQPLAVNPFDLTVSGSEVYFIGYVESNNRQVYTVSAYADGFYAAPDSYLFYRAAPFHTGISSLTDASGTLYVVVRGFYPTTGSSIGLYRHADEPVLVKSFSLGSTGYDSGGIVDESMQNVNGTLYFRANDGISNAGTELWKSDGTPGETVKLAEIISGPQSTPIQSVAGAGNTLFVTANDGVNGFELWCYKLPLPTVTRINVGGGEYTTRLYDSSLGDFRNLFHFGADAYFSGGNVSNSTFQVANEDNLNTELYQTQRWGTFSYNVPVVNGTYNVILHFAELYWGSATPGGTGSRKFNVDMEGSRKLTEYDISARAGGLRYSIKETIPVSVTDGTLNISFLKGSKDNPTVAAIEIIPATPVNTPPVLTAIGNKPATAGQNLSFTASTTDSDQPVQSFTYSLTGSVPGGAAINPTTGVFNWTPVAAGVFTFVVRVTDSGAPALSDEETITVTVNPAGATGAFRVNAGGNGFNTIDARSFAGDAYFSGGIVSISTTKDITGTADDYLYQTGRHGTSFTYNFPTGNGNYDVVLHFAETYFGNVAPGGAGSRRFNVDMEGARKLTDYDIFARAGGALRVAQETFRVRVSDGTLNVSFLKGVADNPAIKAIEVLPAGSVLSINSGGGAFTTTTGKAFAGDVYYAGGSLSSIASGEVANTSDDGLYRNARVGIAFSYGLPSGNGTFDVVLHFAETYWGARASGGAGSRKFNAYLEGVKRLSDYDIFAKAGGAMRAVKETVRVTVTDGVLNLYFAKGAADNPIVSAIEVLPVGTVARLAAEGADEPENGQLLLYPNPVQDKLTVRLAFPATLVKGTAVTDASGAVRLVNAHKATGQDELQLEVGLLQKGFYLLKLDTDQGNKNIKFLKQ